MKPPHFDPNNHAPAVTADDSWGDLAEVAAEVVIPKLPTKRAWLEKLAAAPTAPMPAGLHIQAVLSRVDVSTAPHRLQVQEIGGSGIKRLEQALPMPEKIVHQGGFKPKPDHDPAALGQRGESDEWGQQKRHPTRQYWIMGGSVVAFVILALMLMPLINSFNAPTHQSLKPTLVIDEPEAPLAGVDDVNFLYDQQVAAIRIFSTYATARRMEQVVPLVGDGPQMKEDLSRYWRALDLPHAWVPASDVSWTTAEFGGRTYGLLEGLFPDQSPFAAYFIRQGAGIRLDWKATTGFGTASFAELENGLGDAREIRGVLVPANYYSADLPENEVTSYRFSAASGEQSVWCYVRRGDSAEAVLARLFAKGEIVQEESTAHKVTLRLARGPSPSQPNQWIIQEVIQADWLSPQERP